MNGFGLDLNLTREFEREKAWLAEVMKGCASRDEVCLDWVGGGCRR